MYSPLDGIPSHSALPLDLLLGVIPQKQTADKGMAKPAPRILAGVEIQHIEVLRQELGFREADGMQPLAVGRVPNLVDPDFLVFVCELGDGLADQTHLSWCDIRHDQVFLEQEGANCTGTSKSHIDLYLLAYDLYLSCRLRIHTMYFSPLMVMINTI